MVMNLRPHFLAYPVGRVKMNQHVNIGVVFAWPIMDIKDDVIHKTKSAWYITKSPDWKCRTWKWRATRSKVRGYSSQQLASPLQNSRTWHMGSHSVTYNPAEVTFPRKCSLTYCYLVSHIHVLHFQLSASPTEPQLHLRSLKWTSGFWDMLAD